MSLAKILTVAEAEFRAMTRSKAERSVTRSQSTGNARARHGSMVISSPSANFRM